MLIPTMSSERARVLCLTKERNDLKLKRFDICLYTSDSKLLDISDSIFWPVHLVIYIVGKV